MASTASALLAARPTSIIQLRNLRERTIHHPRKSHRGAATGRGFYDALGSPEILGPDYNPFHTALTGTAVTTRLHTHDNRYLELHITPVPGSDGHISQMISLGRDVTAEIQQQQKLDAL